MLLPELREEVCRQNIRLMERGLVILTEGNVSAISPDRRHVVIKPSGVEYEDMKPSDMVVVDLDGNVIEGEFKPSTDTPTHLEVYRQFPAIGGIAHTHSTFATMFAQKQKPIPCFGTTHADLAGDIPVTRQLSEAEINEAYEYRTGVAICEILESGFQPCVLVASHGPFTFGKTAKEAVNHAQILEKIATMAILGTRRNPIDRVLFEKHHGRKHGEDRYYGQSNH